MWITTLAVPSLKCVRLLGNGEDVYPKHSALVGSIILETVTRICPQLQTLSLFPGTVFDETDGESILLNLTPRKPFLQYLPELRNLTELETRMIAVQQDDMFLVLGQIPQLKQLTLVSGSAESMPDTITLPDHSFPALKHLVLKNLGPLAVNLVLNQLPLVRNIDTLKVFMSIGEGGGGWVVDVFIPHLAKMSHLANLHAYFDEDGNALDFEDIGVPSALSVLAKLPLLTVDLRGAIFDQCVDHDFAKLFPLLTKLQITGQNGHLEWLSAFATIPRLEHLAVKVYLLGELFPFKEDISCQSLHTLETTANTILHCSPSKTNLAAEYVSICTTGLGTHTTQIHRFLLKIFPNIKRVIAPKKLASWGTLAEDEAVVWLNSQINLQRELKNLRACVADECGEKKAASLIPTSFLTNVYEG